MKPNQTQEIDPKREKQLHAKLREHPEVFERIEAILNLASAGSDGQRLNADQIEDLLIEEVRKLGQKTMESWAAGAEERASSDLRAEKPDIRERKKNG